MRISQTEAEGEQGLFAHAVKITVADVHALGVAGVVLLAELADGGVVLPGAPGRGQLAGGIAFPEEEIGKDTAGLDAELAQQQDVAHLRQGGEVDRAADVEHQQKFPVPRVEREDIPLFRLGQQDVAGDGPAVGALAGDAREDIDGGLAASPQRDVVLRLGHHGAHAVDDRQRPALEGGELQLAEEALLRLGADLLVAIHPELAGDMEAGGLETVLDGHEIPGIDFAGAGAALDRAARAAAVETQPAGGLEREAPVAFEQDRAFCAETAHDLVVFSFVIVHVISS